MYGKVIGSSIAVDCFDEVTKNGIYFLTTWYVLDGPLPSHVDRLYTSNYNAEMLHRTYGADSDKVVSISLNGTYLIQDKLKKLKFHVTLFDARQQPGAVMFFFEGEDIGNVLYAGKCCYSDDFFSRRLCNFLKTKRVNYLYIHDACEDCQSHSSTKSAAVEKVISIIRRNSNCKIVVSEPCLREDILVDLKNKFNKLVCVSENIMKHLERLGKESGFTLDQTKSQVIITDKKPIKKRIGGQTVVNVFLLPCSMKTSTQEIQVKLDKLEKKGYHVIFYRNHCSPIELTSLVTDIDAEHTIPIRPPPVTRRKDIDFWYKLGDGGKFMKSLDEIQNREDPENVVENIVPDAELQRAVFCLIGNDETYAIETNKWDSDAPSEASSLK